MNEVKLPPGHDIFTDPVTVKQTERIKQYATAFRVAFPFMFPFYAQFISPARLRPVLPSQIPTAAVDVNKCLYYNPYFIKTLDDKVLFFVLAHEIMHILNGTFFRGEGKKDRDAWNIATDAYINYQLQQDGFKLWDKCIIPVDGKITYQCMNIKKQLDLKGKNCEQIYDMLIDIRRQCKDALEDLLDKLVDYHQASSTPGNMDEGEEIDFNTPTSTPSNEDPQGKEGKEGDEGKECDEGDEGKECDEGDGGEKKDVKNKSKTTFKPGDIVVNKYTGQKGIIADVSDGNVIVNPYLGENIYKTFNNLYKIIKESFTWKVDDIIEYVKDKKTSPLPGSLAPKSKTPDTGNKVNRKEFTPGNIERTSTRYTKMPPTDFNQSKANWQRDITSAQEFARKAEEHKKDVDVARNAARKSLEDALSPELNWKEILREYLTRSQKLIPKTHSWGRFHSATYGTMRPLPVQKKGIDIFSGLSNIVIVLDVSGSIHGRVYSMFCKKVAEIVKTFNVPPYIISYTDTIDANQQISNVGNIKQNLQKFFDTYKPIEGGNNISIVKQAIERAIKTRKIQPPSLIVYFGDGDPGDLQAVHDGKIYPAKSLFVIAPMNYGQAEIKKQLKGHAVVFMHYD